MKRHNDTSAHAPKGLQRAQKQHTRCVCVGGGKVSLCCVPASHTAEHRARLERDQPLRDGTPTHPRLHHILHCSNLTTGPAAAACPPWHCGHLPQRLASAEPTHTHRLPLGMS